MAEYFCNREYAFGHSGYFEKHHELGYENSDAFMQTQWVPLLLTDTGVTIPVPRTPTVIDGIRDFMFRNMDPIKLAVWLAPVIGVILWIAYQSHVIAGKNLELKKQSGEIATTNVALGKAVTKAEEESKRRAKLLEDVARADRATAEDQLGAGKLGQALAYLARSIRNFPSEPAAAQSAALVLNKWPFLAPWNSGDAGMAFDVHAVEFSNSGGWVAAVRYYDPDNASVSVASTAQPTKRIEIRSPFPEDLFNISFLDDEHLALFLRSKPGRKIWHFKAALDSNKPAADFLIDAPDDRSQTTFGRGSDQDFVWSGNHVTANFKARKLTFERPGGAKVLGSLPKNFDRIDHGTFSKDEDVFIAVATMKGGVKPCISAWSTATGKQSLSAPVFQSLEDGKKVELSPPPNSGETIKWYLSPMADAFVVLNEEWAAFGIVRKEQGEIFHLERLDREQKGRFDDAAFSPDGLEVALAISVNGEDLTEQSAAKVFWSQTAYLEAETPVRWWIRGMAGVSWSPDGTFLVLRSYTDGLGKEQVWHAPTAPLCFADSHVQVHTPGSRVSLVDARYDEKVVIERPSSSETVLRESSAVVATLRGDIGKIEGWIHQPGDSWIYVLELRKDPTLAEEATWIGRWDIATGALFARAKIAEGDPNVRSADLLVAENKLIVSGQLSSWVGDATTLSTLLALEDQWTASSPSFLWHATTSQSRYDNSQFRLVSQVTGSATLPFDTGRRGFEGLAFAQSGHQVFLFQDEDKGLKGAAESWELLETRVPPPDWFSDFLFTVCFQDFDAKGRLSYDAGNKGVFPQRFIEMIESDQSNYGQLARWFLQRGAADAKWPGTNRTAREIAAELLREPTPENLHRAFLLDRKCPGLQTALSGQSPNPVAAALRRKHIVR